MAVVRGRELVFGAVKMALLSVLARAASILRRRRSLWEISSSSDVSGHLGMFREALFRFR